MGEARSSAVKLAWALAYVACSLVMLLGNKGIWFLHNVNDVQVTTVLFQNTVAVVLLWLFQKKEPKAASDVQPMQVIRDIFFLEIFFTLKLISSLAAYQYVGIATFTLLKNLGTIFTMVSEYILFKTPITRFTIVAFLVMILAVLFYIQFDVQFSAMGYALAMFNCVVSSCYLLTMQHVTAKSKHSKTTLVFYINLASVPLLAATAFCMGETSSAIETVQSGSVLFLAVNVLVAVVGGTLGFVSLCTVQCLGAGAYSFVGSLVKVPAVLIGTVLFGDKLNVYSGAFCALGVLASVIFSIGQSATHTCPAPVCSPAQRRALSMSALLLLVVAAAAFALSERTSLLRHQSASSEQVWGPTTGDLSAAVEGVDSKQESLQNMPPTADTTTSNLTSAWAAETNDAQTEQSS